MPGSCSVSGSRSIHLLNQTIASKHHAVAGESRPVPAVTGSLTLLPRASFQNCASRKETGHRVCVEDVRLCLGLRQQLGLGIHYCPVFSSPHGSQNTRSSTPN